MLRDLRNFSIIQDYTAVLQDISLSGRCFLLLLLFFGPPVHVQRHKEQDKEQKKNKTTVMGSISILTIEVPDNIACELQHINLFCAAG